MSRIYAKAQEARSTRVNELDTGRYNMDSHMWFSDSLSRAWVKNRLSNCTVFPSLTPVRLASRDVSTDSHRSHGNTYLVKDIHVSYVNIYIFIAIALDESIFLDVLHSPTKNIKSHDLEATPMGGATSKPASDVVCLLLLA